MKKLLFAMMLAAIMISCSERHRLRETYSCEEVVALIAIKQAVDTKVMITVQDSIKCSVVKIDNCAYYPGISQGGSLRYYLVKK